MENATDPIVPAPMVVLFDGTCGLCDRAVGFILKHDTAGRFRFAPLQSQIARNLMIQHQLDPDKLDSIVLVDGDRAYIKSTAVIRILMDLKEPFPLLGILIFLPSRIRDDAYDFIARHRHEWFKPPSACRTPTPEEHERFLA